MVNIEVLIKYEDDSVPLTRRNYILAEPESKTKKQKKKIRYLKLIYMTKKIVSVGGNYEANYIKYDSTTKREYEEEKLKNENYFGGSVTVENEKTLKYKKNNKECKNCKYFSICLYVSNKSVNFKKEMAIEIINQIQCKNKIIAQVRKVTKILEYKFKRERNNDYETVIINNE